MKAGLFQISVGFVLLGICVGGGGLAALSAFDVALTAGLIVYHVIAGLIVAVVPVLLLRVTVIARIDALKQTMRALHKDGDLSRRATVGGTDAIGATALAFNELIGSFQGIVSKVCFNAFQVGEAADKLINDAKSVAAGSDEQRRAAEAAQHAMQEMTIGVNQVAENAELTAGNAQAALDVSQKGSAIAAKAAADIERIAHAVEDSARLIVGLGERSRAISGIVRVIRDIADQTNLLALNAAIEAARAGEQGRGFAVVADEVRKLAENTSRATAEINDMIQAIQSETQTAITSIEQGSGQVKGGAELARQAAESLQQINQGAEQTMEKVEAIAAAIQEQSTNGQYIAGHVEEILKLAGNNNASAGQTLQQATMLESLAVNLKEISNVFKLGPRGDDVMAIHARMPAVAQQAAKEVGRLLEDAVKNGQIEAEDLFDYNYIAIPNTKPQKHRNKFDALTDQLLPALQERVLEGHPEVVYSIACDVNGYVPTHNKRFAQPLTGNEKIDFVNNRTKRIFDDPVGKKCGAHEKPFLLQTYRRDTGEIMHDISVPIYVKDRHWGGFRMGYRTD